MYVTPCHCHCITQGHLLLLQSERMANVIEVRINVYTNIIEWLHFSFNAVLSPVMILPRAGQEDKNGGLHPFIHSFLSISAHFILLSITHYLILIAKLKWRPSVECNSIWLMEPWRHPLNSRHLLITSLIDERTEF